MSQASERAISELFEKRLLITVGKGGVGKTTVSCALGQLAAAAGKRTLVAEVDGAGRAASMFGIGPGKVGQAQEVATGLSVMSIEGTVALEEYLQIIIPVKRFLQAVFNSQIYRYFVAAAPGLKELMTIGKIWYEAERIDPRTGKPQWDLVILDAPATGHGLQYLGMPRAAHDVFNAGLVGRESRRLIDLLTDPQRCAVNLVTTAEEMPFNETCDMYDRIVEKLEMPLGYLFVNRVHKGNLGERDASSLDEFLQSDSSADEHRDCLNEVLERAREEIGWATINREYLQRMADRLDLPRCEIPFLFSEEFGKDELAAVTSVVAAQ